MTVPLASMSAGSFVSPVAIRKSSREPFAEERDWMAVPGDHLLVLDPCATERLLNPPAWMYAGTLVIAMTDEQRRGPLSFLPLPRFHNPLT